MRIKDISLENRPRERLEKHGPSVLSDAELLAIILKTGTKEENVIDMSNRLISKYGFDKLSACSLSELQEINGIGSAKMSFLDREQFMILHLDIKNRVLKDEIVSIGALTGTIAHPREVFKSAVKESAYSVILVHNHPSGDPTPSDEDLRMTKRLLEAGEILGIKVLDHVIVGKEEWWSYTDHNLNV